MGISIHFRYRAAVAVVSLAVGCGEPQSETTSCKPTKDAVLFAAEGLIAADNRHDLESVLDHYTDDITFMTPEGDLVEGKPSIRPRYQELFQNFVVDIRMDSEEVGIGGDWAFVRGRNLGTLTSRTTESVQALDDRFLMILRCEPPRGWRVSRLTWVHVR